MSRAETCRHCKTGVVKRPRGLCWTCYYADGVRARYDPTSKYGVRGTGHNNTRSPAAFATDAWPGSPEKIDVMRIRASLHQDVFHPQDAVPV